jgi:2-polyprenyl-3-methyl-5-hydroxy-6-metoxy-1,4-benzoquinol methylase
MISEKLAPTEKQLLALNHNKMKLARKKHWENIYKTKTPNEVSWTQKIPKTSLNFIYSYGLPKDAKIIDIGGGDSTLVDYLLHEGYENISVLDISGNALQKVKERLGEKAGKINWIESDIMDFKPDTTFDLWHDRAAFHFLKTHEQISKYVEIASKFVRGYLILGTFSEEGPKKCSGLEINQYSETSLTDILKKNFKKIQCIEEIHTTPFRTKQSFLFCSFIKQLT